MPTLPQLQFLDLAQIDKDIQTTKALEAKNALAPFVRRQTEMDLEKSGLELQAYRDQVERDRQTREALAAYEMRKRNGGAIAPAAQSPTDYAPGGEMSPKIGGPDWMQSYQAQQPKQLTPAQPAGGGKQALMQDFLNRADIYAEKGDFKTANMMYEHAGKFMPEVHKIEVAMDNGKPVNVITYKDGTQQVSQFGATPKLHFADNGQQTAIPVDEYTGQVTGKGIQKLQSPESIASNATQRYLHNTPSATAQLNAQQGKIPPGYRVSSDGSRLEAIPGGPADIGKALPSPAVKELSGAGTAYENTQRLQNTFKDDFGGKVILGDMSNTMGRIFGDESGQAQWWQDMEQQQNQTRHELFGSALTKTELAAWEKTAVTPNMDANQIRQNLQRRSEIEARAASKVARAYQSAGYNKDQIRELLGSASQYLESPAPPAGSNKGAPASGGQTQAGGAFVAKTMPDPAKYNGYTVTDQSSGVKYKSNGSNWVRVKQ